MLPILSSLNPTFWSLVSVVTAVGTALALFLVVFHWKYLVWLFSFSKEFEHLDNDLPWLSLTELQELPLEKPLLPSKL